MNDPLTQLQLWKLLNKGAVVRLGSSELRLQHSDQGEYVVVTNGVERHCTSVGDAAITLLTIEGVIEEK